MIRHMESSGYFDAMEVLYYDDMMGGSSTDSPTTSDSGGEGVVFDEDYNREQDIMCELRGGMCHTNQQKQLHELARDRRHRLKKSIRVRPRKLKRVMSEPQSVMTIDKISFVCGLRLRSASAAS